jgi:hypothetical protein
MTNIGVFLVLDLESANAQKLTSEEVLNAAVCDLGNWKLRDGIYDIYPHWKGLCDATESQAIL